MTPELAENYLWKHGKKFCLMSASFLPVPILAKTLGIDTDDIDYHIVPSMFPPERRPVYLQPVANLTSKSMTEEVPKLLDRIQLILHNHPDTKGLIHSVSYNLCNQIMEGVNSKRLITHNGQNRQEIIDMFQESDKPLVLVSPSCERGISLEFDMCRFIIIAKFPYLNLADKIISRRLYSGAMGRNWYIASGLLTILQMSGRAVRSADDFAETFILDMQAKKAITEHPLFLPRWYLDAVEFG